MNNPTPLWCDVEYRDDIGNWLNQHGLTGSAAEIGCAYGGFARTVLSKWQGKRYYMVDPWVSQPADVYRERTEGIDFNQYYRDCSALANSDPRVTLIRKFSTDAAVDIPALSLDFVFIDGNHAYAPVLADLDAWFPKVRVGGLMGLHDYGNDTNYPNFCEVKSAVDRWCAEHGRMFVYSRCNSVWIMKHRE